MTGGITTTYTLDLNAGLVQVLADSGGNTYLYGPSTGSGHALGRIAQFAGSTANYYLADHLGSVRQLTNASGAVTLAKGYQPYGTVLSSAGTGASNYGFTGEWTDSYIKLTYLRARYYASDTGRFITRDVWPGDYSEPLTLNRWGYVEGNPVNRIDPTGQWAWFGIPLGTVFNPSVYHTMAQYWYDGFAGANPNKQIEFPYACTGSFCRRPDIFNSLTGDLYEIEPLGLAYSPFHGVNQANGYVLDLTGRTLQGCYPFHPQGVPYNGCPYWEMPFSWTGTPFHLGLGFPDWPGPLHVSPAPGFPDYDYHADWFQPGLVIYWFQLNNTGARRPPTEERRTPNKRDISDGRPRLPRRENPTIEMWFCNFVLVSDGGNPLLIQPQWDHPEDILNGQFDTIAFDRSMSPGPGWSLHIDYKRLLGIPIAIWDEGLHDSSEP